MHRSFPAFPVTLLAILPACELVAGVDERSLVDGAALDGSLVDRGLVARYFVDEAASGPATTLTDSAPAEPSLLLSVEEDGQSPILGYDGSEGHRGLRWAQAGVGDRMAQAVDGTKLEELLAGASQITFEVVVQLYGAPLDIGAYLMTIGAHTEPLMALAASDADSLELLWNGSSTEAAGRWSVARPGERWVIHLVLDTDAARPADRRALFQDGVRLSNVVGDDRAPSQGQSIRLATNTGPVSFVLGNAASGYHSPEGILYYAAIYGTALTPGEVAQNATRLLSSDDGS